MNVLICYASAGAGHRKAAEALYEYLLQNRPELSVQLVDAVDYSSPLLKWSYRHGYPFVVTHLPTLWLCGFWFTHTRWLRWLSRPLGRMLELTHAIPLINFLLNENPDYIISTHYFPGHIAALLKRTKRINSHVHTVITDFAVHNLWIATGIEQYWVASSESEREVRKQAGLNAPVTVSGIPVSVAFTRSYDRLALRHRYGLQPHTFTILMSTGSFGMGPIEDLLAQLTPYAQVIVTCGANARLFSRLSAEESPRVKVFGIVSAMHELMALSDLIITKPGGLTISESLIMGLYPVFITAIPGQETENCRILARHAIGLRTTSPFHIAQFIHELQKNLKVRQEISRRLKEVARPHATEEICNALR